MASSSNPTSPETGLSQEPHLLHRSLHSSPHLVTHAKGNYIHFHNGHKVFDACSGSAVTAIGHGNDEVLDAVTKQMQQVSYIHTMSYTTRAAEDLADLVLEGNPGGLEKVYFCGSGSEAMDAALKLARQYYLEISQPNRTRFISRQQSYHGNTFGAMSVSSNIPRKAPYLPLLMPAVSHVSPAYSYRHQLPTESTSTYVSRLATELDAEFHRLGPENVIGFIAEPIVGATTGCVPAPPGYFQAIRKICDKHGALLILDEIMCGMGRSGSQFCFQQEGEGALPDIVTTGKGLGGGYAPIGAVMVSTRVVEGLRAGSGAYNHGQTYQAHPVGCAAALAVQRIIRRENLIENCREMGKVLEQELRSAFGEKRFVGDVRGRGLFWGVEFVEEKETKACFEPEVAFGRSVQERAFELGVAVYPGAGTADGRVGDHVIVAPAFNVSEQDIKERIVPVLRRAYEDVERRVLESA